MVTKKAASAAFFYGAIELPRENAAQLPYLLPHLLPAARCDPVPGNALPNASLHPFVEPAPASQITPAAEFARQSDQSSAGRNARAMASVRLGTQCYLSCRTTAVYFRNRPRADFRRLIHDYPHVTLLIPSSSFSTLRKACISVSAPSAGALLRPNRLFAFG